MRVVVAASIAGAISAALMPTHDIYILALAGMAVGFVIAWAMHRWL